MKQNLPRMWSTPNELPFEVLPAGRDEKLSSKEVIPSEFEFVHVAVLGFCDEKGSLNEVASNELLELVPVAVLVFRGFSSITSIKDYLILSLTF